MSASQGFGPEIPLLGVKRLHPKFEVTPGFDPLQK
jgi:hypothetical protein